jgi:hypothetical protein
VDLGGIHVTRSLGKNLNYIVAAILLIGAAGATALLLASDSKAPEVPPKASAQIPGMTQGKVVETMNSGGYTYVLLDTGGKTLWVAGPQTTVSVGDQIVVPPGSPMSGFESASLGRTFDQIDFVGSIQVQGAQAAPGAPAAMPPGHPTVAGSAPTVPAEVKVEKAEKGLTVAEIYAQKDSLAGKSVILRARVVKYSEAIMGKNWLHLQDGSGEQGSHDLTVTTQDRTQVGDQVLVEGKVTLDVNLGSGYHYDLLLEEAKVSVEPAG